MMIICLLCSLNVYAEIQSAESIYNETIQNDSNTSFNSDIHHEVCLSLGYGKYACKIYILDYIMNDDNWSRAPKIIKTPSVLKDIKDIYKFYDGHYVIKPFALRSPY